MTTAEKLAISILLLIARWIAPYAWRKDIEVIDAHVACTTCRPRNGRLCPPSDSERPPGKWTDLAMLQGGRVSTLPPSPDARTYNRQMLDAIRSVLRGKASDDVEMYKIGGRELTRVPWNDLLQAEAHYEALGATSGAVPLANPAAMHRLSSASWPAPTPTRRAH